MTIGDLRRICSHVEIQDDGCWLWTASTTKGYGCTSFGRANRQYAHRAFYMGLVGPIPAELELDHLCRVPRCVNPRHLEPVTRRENTLRGAKCAPHLKTHCVNGHPYTEENVYRRPNGRRLCLVCKREQQRTTAGLCSTSRSTRRPSVSQRETPDAASGRESSC